MRLVVALAVYAAIGHLGTGAAAAQDDAELRRLTDEFFEAERVFNSIDQPDSVAMFGRIINALERRSGAGDQDRERSLLVDSYAYRARANFNMGANQQAAEDVRSLVDLDPGVELDRVQVSPRFLQMFDAIHAAMVGYLEFAVTPADAAIIVDGKRLETATLMHPVIAGLHSVVVERPGYLPVNEDRAVSAGATVRVERALVRASSVVKIVTRPVGASIKVDGRTLGVSHGEAPMDFMPTGDAASYSRSEFSAELVVEGLQPGTHTVEASLEGYRPRRYDLEVSGLGDFRAVIVLDPAAGTVVLEGLTPDAALSVDGNLVTPEWPAGRDEAPRVAVAPGRHAIEVSRGTGGVFAAEVEVADQQVAVVQVRLRPGLAFLGILGGDDRGARDLAAALRARLGAVDDWSMLDRTWAGSTIAAVGLSVEALRAAAAADVAAGLDWSAVQSAVDRDAPGSVYMLGVLNDDLLATSADLWIWPAAPGPPQPDIVRVALSSEADIDALAGAFVAADLLRTGWFGALLVDLEDGALVGGVTPGSPAAEAGLEAGDRVVSIGGEPGGAAALRARIAASPPGTTLAVQVQRGGAGRALEVRIGASPQVISPWDPNIVYSLVSASLAGQAAAAEVDGGPDWTVRLNQAAVLMHTGAWADAVRTLRSIEDAPGGAGVGQAMVDYWLGIALTALGPNYREGAIQALQRAAGDPQARLFHNDGPWVAPRARARLAELGG